MEKTTSEKLKADFEAHYNHKYSNNAEFISAVEKEYSIKEDGENYIFSGGEDDFIVTNWASFANYI